MSKYYEIDAQSKFKVHKVSDKETHIHEGITDEARLIYSEIDERLYIGDLTDWMLVSTPYDIFNQNTKVLMGQWPLPDGWNLDTTYNDIAVLTCNTSGALEGSWIISGIEENEKHRHGMGGPTTTIRIGKSEIYSSVATYYHIHSMSKAGNHFHGHDGNWRPYHIKYCVAIYQ